MDIKLVGALPIELRQLGLKPGDKFQEVETAWGHRKGAVVIRFTFDDLPAQAVVYPENYIVMDKGKKANILGKSNSVIHIYWGNKCHKNLKWKS
jgi:hypothetical protein